MKTVCKKDQCAGCKACVEICSKKAIQIVDSVVAYNAIIDEDKCINCGACHKICQANKLPVQLEPIIWKEGWANDQKIREKASSGGMATAIELAFVNNGGTVCSCSLKNGDFCFSFAHTEKEVIKFTGSKYVKSNPEGIYRKINDKLKKGENVLFVGLPCQVAAVKNFVGDKEKLYTIDLICHGTPSPKILEHFFNDYHLDIRNAQNIKFRVKTKFYLESDKKRFTVPTVVDNYLMTFLDSASYTENCYNCKYAKPERVSDITLGDSWGSELAEDIQRKGVSLVLCQTEKGKALLEQTDLHLLDVDLKRAIQWNHQLNHPSIKPKQRDKFLKEINKGKKFKRCVWISYPKRCTKKFIKTILYKTKITRGGK
ncbi:MULTISPECIES: Coenzyme F420 hydrogenase/dehydrogenase, beta subunit C-terminal domain [unclassified Amedibacterium]|uniref:Coenzyme F420 hydrogenase/dehydrogenase, beta subunit C-terminal domain n=1 Tax=unclassified Amedibacterium TaxID=3088137 RepID=UPI000E3F4576|nr:MULTISPECIES: Coenzyme F420 hydrogenase/dehydrogenase, beta subunit C-terminal domain [unclassified Absiella]RGB65529.1 4Fe-4S dicluster domain-containing protein [Absiella sp. AM09-45]RGB74515.1 4Fe-4S dicluster domain-containing protein [Absiella sp. AM09-50]RGC53204.1 4Fe-4S dicluster domain-containing protein [Absiella sp. AM29-15]